MKRTTSIHIKGINFIIEEEAYETLKNYMDRLSQKLSNAKDKEEIIEDIELRIAELFQAELNDSKEVIEEKDVEKTIATLGEPEQYIDEEFAGESSEKVESENQYASGENRGEYEGGGEKKLYRDMEKASIAGVCSGLSAYFKIDLIIVRIIFLVLLFVGGFAFPLYIILWIVLPTANSHIDRLRMKGTPITVESVREEVEMAAERLTKSSKKWENDIKSDTVFTKGVHSIGKIISKIIGFVMLLFGFALSIFFVIVVLLKKGITPVSDENGMLSPYDLANLAMESDLLYQFWWIGGFFILVFVVFIIATSMRFILNIRFPWYKRFSQFTFVMSILAVIFGFYIGISIGKEFSADGERKTNMISTIKPFELKYETMDQHRFKDKNVRSRAIEEFYVNNGRIYHEGFPVHIKESKDSSFHVFNVRSSDGEAHEEAVSKASHIDFKWKYEKDKLTVPNYYSYPKKDKLRGQEIDLIIEIPVGDSILFDEEYYSPDEDSYRIYIPTSRQKWHDNDWD